MMLSRPRVALSALTLTLALSGCVAPSSTADYGTMDDPRYAQLLDMIDAALQDNMTVVLVADLMPHATLKDAMTMTQWTGNVIWLNAAEPRITFGRKFQNNSLQRDKDATYLFKAFEVHILPPGKYLLTGGDDYRLNALLDQVGAQPGPAGSGRGANGTAYLSPELYREFYKETNWHPGSTSTQIRTRKVCTAVHMASGACVSWGEQQYTETTPGVLAGYYEDTTSRDIPAIKVQARIPPRQALASFTLKGGQFVLSRRMHLKTPSYQYKQSACRAVDPKMIECPLENLTVYTRPAPMAFSQKLFAQRANLSDQHRALLARLEPMQITPLGHQGMEDPIWGVPLSLRKGK
ncbi:hypothetical protein LMG26696_04923 [Achromobacter pulmonis]|uniref:hypothetical protein n=1 Tax=Achromobacter pulmonis TaxID=1389932 RepID=UPI001466B3B0|nr:hypothetical protein [Achromobacter pulmonis]CAB3691326.1 hypothetical protein LMG26696_04923 [Achromobacter pulmonis]